MANVAPPPVVMHGLGNQRLVVRLFVVVITRVDSRVERKFLRAEVVARRALSVDRLTVDIVDNVWCVYSVLIYRSVLSREHLTRRHYRCDVLACYIRLYADCVTFYTYSIQTVSRCSTLSRQNDIDGTCEVARQC